MTKFIDVTMRDVAGAAEQWRTYITGTLGFDNDITVQVGVNNGRGEIWLTASDAFQRRDGIYDEQIGTLRLIEHYNLNDDWDAACIAVWARVKKAMGRDERELRAGLKMMGGIIEHAPSFTSLVGKMFADRIRVARDEATNHMIEHHGWTAPHVAKPLTTSAS